MLKTPPASVLIKKAAKINKGSGEPKDKKVGSITMDQLKVSHQGSSPAQFRWPVDGEDISALTDCQPFVGRVAVAAMPIIFPFIWSAITMVHVKDMPLWQSKILFSIIFLCAHSSSRTYECMLKRGRIADRCSPPKLAIVCRRSQRSSCQT